MTLFARAASHQAAVGDSGRHARLPDAPPPNPMPIGEARALIGKLVNAWIAALWQQCNLLLNTNGPANWQTLLAGWRIQVMRIPRLKSLSVVSVSGRGSW